MKAGNKRTVLWRIWEWKGKNNNRWKIKPSVNHNFTNVCGIYWNKWYGTGKHKKINAVPEDIQIKKYHDHKKESDKSELAMLLQSSTSHYINTYIIFLIHRWRRPSKL